MGRPKPAIAPNSYGAALLYKYKGKKVEVNCGDTAITMLYDDHTVDQKSLIRGRIVDVIGDALVLMCDTLLGTETEVLVNCWSINTVTEFDATGITKNIFYNEGSRWLKRS